MLIIAVMLLLTMWIVLFGSDYREA